MDITLSEDGVWLILPEAMCRVCDITSVRLNRIRHSPANIIIQVASMADHIVVSAYDADAALTLIRDLITKPAKVSA